MRVRRSSFVFFYVEENEGPSLDSFFYGHLLPRTPRAIWALPAAYGAPCQVQRHHLDLFLGMSDGDWTEIDELDAPGIAEMASVGIILVEDEDAEHQEYLRREEALRRQQWNVYAAVYHFLTRGGNSHLDPALPADLHELADRSFYTPQALAGFVDRYGPPSPHFHKVPAERVQGVQALPLPEDFLRTDAFLNMLRSRRTCREYDPEAPVALEQFSKLLYTVFACQGLAHLYEDIWAVKRTSPSGGALHPIETYVLAINVSGCSPGLYHYRMEEHKLEALEYLPVDEARELANEFTQGQSYPRWCSALCIMTARFYRNYWKYRRHPRAYPVLYMDCAHLSQTFYLAAAQLGLGAFVTGGIYARNIERRLKLDPYSEGPLLICGCGIPRSSPVGFDLAFSPYTPPGGAGP